MNPSRKIITDGVNRAIAAGSPVIAGDPATPERASQMLDDEIERTEPLYGKASADDVKRMADAIAFRLNLTALVDDDGVTFASKG